MRMRRFRISAMNRSDKQGRLGPVILMVLVCTASCAAQSGASGATQDPEVFGSAVKSFLIAEQEALESDVPDRVLKGSAPVAVASLALLTSMDQRDQQTRNALSALPYAQGLIFDLPTQLVLLRMELSLGEAAPAAEFKKHILATNPVDAKLHVTLCQILGSARQMEDAVREAQHAVEFDPASREAQTALGMAYWGLNGFQYNEEALRAFTRAHEIDPDGFVTNLFLGTLESQYQRFDAATSHLRAAAAADPSAPDPWYQLGMNAWEQSDPPDAVEFLGHYLSLAESRKNGKPSQLRLALLTLDQIAEGQGKTPEAAHRAEEDALKRQLLQTGGANGADASAATLPMGSPDTADRSPLPQNADAVSSTTASEAKLRELAANALGNIGTVFARKRDYAAAIVAFKFAIAEDPTQEQVIRNLGLAACVSESYEETARALKRTLAAHPDDMVARGCLGTAELETGQYPDAAKTFAYLGPELSSKPLYEATAAAAFARAGDRELAEKALADLESADANPILQAREAIAYLDLGKADRAQDLAEKALNSASQAPPEALHVLGLLDLVRGNPAKAVAEFQKECQVDHPDGTDHLEAEALLAQALIKSGKRSEGEEISLQLIRSNPDLVSSLVHVSEELLKNGDSHAAYEKGAAAMALAPHERQVRAAFDSASRAIQVAGRLSSDSN